MHDGAGPTRRDLLMTAAAGATLGAAPLPALRGPVDVERRRVLLGKPMTGFGCRAVVPPVHDLDIPGYYTDKSFTVIDPVKQRQASDIVRPLSAFTWELAKLSDAWMLTRPARPEPAQCVLNWLDAWASADALLGRMVQADAQHQRKWTLCGMTLDYLKVRGSADLDPGAKARVERWFPRVADAAAEYYARWGRAGYNNHIIWLALGMTAAGVAANDHALFDRGITICRDWMEEIQPDGTLPKELDRKGLAFGYHVFSLAPLVMIAEIGAANGLDLYAEKGGAVHRLANCVLKGLADPAWFAAKAGAAQHDDNKVTPFTFVWAEPYYARFPDPALGRQIAANRPLFYATLGGSVTDAFGSPSLPFKA
jgi:poly(beta-D-mannuronate) lyase